jgi:hypothetical protein
MRRAGELERERESWRELERERGGGWFHYSSSSKPPVLRDDIAQVEENTHTDDTDNREEDLPLLRGHSDHCIRLHLLVVVLLLCAAADTLWVVLQVVEASTHCSKTPVLRGSIRWSKERERGDKRRRRRRRRKTKKKERREKGKEKRGIGGRRRDGEGMIGS